MKMSPLALAAILLLAMNLPDQAFGGGPPDSVGGGPSDWATTDGPPNGNGVGGRPNFDGTDETSVRYMFKYRNQQGKSSVARLGRSGQLDVDIPGLRIAAVTTARGNVGAIFANPNIEAVEVDHEVSADVLPRNLFRGSGPQQQQQQQQHRELAEQRPYGVTMVQADHFDENVPLPANPIKVCVVDTGYDVGHEDLPYVNDGFTPNYGIFEGQTWSVDGHGHGTHVAGTIGAIGENNIGVDSILSDPGRFEFFIGKGLSDSGSGYTSSVLAAVQACVDADAKVVNLSLGCGSCYSAFLEEEYKNIFDQGVLLVAAAGNGGDSGDVHYPASYRHMMAVAAVDSNENRASFSQINDQVEIAAPGKGILSTHPGDTYVYRSGTSMASPHVAGVAALVWGLFPQCSNLQIRNVLLKTAKGTGCNNEYGHGIVQARDAYDLLNAEGCEAGGETPNSPSDRNLGGCDQSSACEGAYFKLELHMDNYPGETSHQLVGPNGMISEISVGVYTSQGSAHTAVHCLTAPGVYTFTIFDGLGDGICCGYGNGSYQLYLGGEQIHSGGDFEDSESHEFNVGPTMTPPEPTPDPTSPPPTPPPTPVKSTPELTAPPTPLPTPNPTRQPTKAPTPPPSLPPVLSQCGLFGASCGLDGDCCSSKCRGPRGRMRCKNN